MNPPLIVRPKTIIQIVVNNQTGEVGCTMDSPVPFPQLVTIFGQLLSTFAGQVTQQQAVPPIAAPQNGAKRV